MLPLDCGLSVRVDISIFIEAVGGSSGGSSVKEEGSSEQEINRRQLMVESNSSRLIIGISVVFLFFVIYQLYGKMFSTPLHLTAEMVNGIIDGLQGREQKAVFYNEWRGQPYQRIRMEGPSQDDAFFKARFHHFLGQIPIL